MFLKLSFKTERGNEFVIKINNTHISLMGDVQDAMNKIIASNAVYTQYGDLTEALGASLFASQTTPVSI